MDDLCTWCKSNVAVCRDECTEYWGCTTSAGDCMVELSSEPVTRDIVTIGDGVWRHTAHIVTALICRYARASSYNLAVLGTMENNDGMVPVCCTRTHVDGAAHLYGKSNCCCCYVCVPRISTVLMLQINPANKLARQDLIALITAWIRLRQCEYCSGPPQLSCKLLSML